MAQATGKQKARLWDARRKVVGLAHRDCGRRVSVGSPEGLGAGLGSWDRVTGEAEWSLRRRGACWAEQPGATMAGARGSRTGHESQPYCRGPSLTCAPRPCHSPLLSECRAAFIAFYFFKVGLPDLVSLENIVVFEKVTSNTVPKLKI